MLFIEPYFQLFEGYLRVKETITKADFLARVKNTTAAKKVGLFIYGLRYTRVKKDEFGNVSIE